MRRWRRSVRLWSSRAEMFRLAGRSRTAILPISEFQDLFDLIGTTYGGDGVS